MTICPSTERRHGKLLVCIADHSQTQDHQFVEADMNHGLVHYSPPPDPLVWIIVGIILTVMILFGVYITLATGTI